MTAPAAASLQSKPASVVPAASDPLVEYPPWDRAARDEQRSGLAVTRAKQLLLEAPEAVETAEALLDVAPATYETQNRTDDALTVIRAIFEKHPRSIARTMQTVMYHSSAFDRDGARDYQPVLRDLCDLAQRQIAGLPKPEAADLVYELMRTKSWVNRQRGGVPTEAIEAFMAEYPGTDAALRAELDLLSRSTPDVFKRVEALARFSAEHEGTCAAAVALRMESADVGSNLGTRGGAAGEDPTERTLRVLEIERQLESNQYKRCPSTFGRSPAYVFASKPAYAPGNIDRLLAAYRGYLRTHLNAASDDPNDGVGFIVNSTVRKLFEAKGEGVEALDRFLADLEPDAIEPGAARYLRALVYEPLSAGKGPGTGPAPPAQTVARLTELHETGSAFYQRKALATLAWLYGFYGDSRRAREYYAEYARAYPQSGYAWLAALRCAECAADLGDWKTAADGYQSVSRNYAAMPVASALGHAYGARAREALNDFEGARTEYQAALGAWNDDYGPRYTSGTQRRARPSADFLEMVRDPHEITPLQLETRFLQLTRTLAAPGGTALEQGRWLLDHDRRKEAAALLADFAERYPKSANAAEAQYLAHKARLYDALEMLNVEGENNERAGLAALEHLAGEPYDFPVTAANITRACVLWKQGQQQEASTVMEAALRERVAKQQLRDPATDLERDVAAIRSLLFVPTGGALFAQAGWNAFSWPAKVPSFAVASAEARVKMFDGRIARITLCQRFPGLTNVVLLNGDELDFFSRMISKVGGTERRVPQAVMETPNQPAGPSVNVMTFLNKFFPMRPGHWGGWEFLTYPVITEIQFLDAARTRARAKVTIGYSGCDVLLEKAGGAWKTTGTTNMWVT